MNTWVFLLLVTSYTTCVQSDDNHGSASSPVVIRKEYPSGSQDQITGESSPRTIFIYPPNGGSSGGSRSGLHEDSKYHRPGVLHSRYQASSREGVTSKSSQLNTLPLLSQGRNQDNSINDSLKDSRHYGSSSASSPSHNNYPSDIHDQLPSESSPRATYVHAPPHHGSHEETRDELRDNLKYDNSRSDPSHHNSFSQHSSDQSFEGSSPHVTYILPPHDPKGGNHENRIGGKLEDLKYPNSKHVPSGAHNHFSPTPQDQSFVATDPHSYDHFPHSGSNEERRDEQQRNPKYNNPTSNPSVPNHDGFLSFPHDHSSYESTSIANYETQNKDLKYHSLTRNHPAVLHSDTPSHHQDQSPDRSPSRVNFDHHSYDGNYKQIGDKQYENSKYHSTTSNPHVPFHDGISSIHHDPSTELSTSRAKFPLHPYEETHEASHKNNPQDLNYRNPASSPSVVFQSGYSSNTHVQSSDQISPQGHLLHPHQREVPREDHDVQGDVKYTEHSSSASVNHQSESPSKTNDQSSDESFHHTVFTKPPPNKKYWTDHDGRQEDSRYVISPRNPSTAVRDVHPLISQVDPIQKNHHFNPQPRPQFDENIKTSHDLGYQNSEMSPPKYIYNSYVDSPNEDIRIKNHHQFDQSQISNLKSHNGNHNSQFEQFRYQDHNVFSQQVQKGSFEERHPIAKDYARYNHEDAASNKYMSEHNRVLPGNPQEYESHPLFYGHTALPQTEHEIHNHHKTHPTQYTNFPQHQQLESPNSRHVQKHSEHSGVHRENSGYASYSGPYTRPQVLHDGPNTHEVASITVEPFGSPKAQPPREFQPISHLENQYPVGPSRPDTHHFQEHSLAENQYGENVREQETAVNNGLPDNRLSQFAPHTLNNDLSGNHQSQLQKPNNYLNAVTSRPQIYEGSIRGDDHRENYSSEKNRVPEQHNESPHQYPYSGPTTSSPYQQGNFNAYIPSNYTKNEQFGTVSRFQTNPSYPYGGEYVNHHGSNNNGYHTSNQHERIPPVPQRNSNSVSYGQPGSYNSTTFYNLRPINNPLSHSSDLHGGSFGDHHSTGVDGHSGPYQEHHAHQALIPNSQVFHEGYNNTTSENFNTALIPPNSGGYHDGNYHSKGIGVQQQYTPQDHSNSPFINHQIRHNIPAPNSPVVAPANAEHFNHAGHVPVNKEQQDGSVHQKSHPSGNHLYPGIHHEYALQFSFNKPKPITHQALNLIPNFNQSQHFAVTSAPQIYAGHLDSGTQHPSGPVRYIDTQYGYAPHMPYHAVPVVKPIVLQSGYQEDTHEISHAKHDLHVHHSSQSGYQYGIIN